jgi:hypothetical protein
MFVPYPRIHIGKSIKSCHNFCSKNNSKAYYERNLVEQDKSGEKWGKKDRNISYPTPSPHAGSGSTDSKIL